MSGNGLIVQQIVEHEQHGEARADYGKGLLKELATRLTTDLYCSRCVDNNLPFKILL